MSRRTCGLALIVLASLVIAVTPASAHEEKRIGPLTMETGWLQEPAYAGVPNAVEVGLSRGKAPVRDAALTVQVVFGEADAATRSDPLPLDPVADDPGEYRAFVIPTRPGTYSFLITGRAADKKVDEELTSGPKTFDDVIPASDAQFPQADPSQGELGDRLERIDARLAALRAQLADGGQGDEGAPLWLSALGLFVAVMALVVALTGRRRRGAG